MNLKNRLALTVVLLEILGEVLFWLSVAIVVALFIGVVFAIIIL